MAAVGMAPQIVWRPLMPHLVTWVLCTQVETAKLYQSAGVNPLAGCLPTLATIPVFIGLYR